MYGQRPPSGSAANRPQSSRVARPGIGASPVPPSPGGQGWGGRDAGSAGSRGPADRPVTQQGLASGIKARAPGPGRLVQDISFFQAELRSKIALIQKELMSFTNEQDVIERENANYLAFERKGQGLADELGAMQDTLGDYNTLLDKLHAEEDVDVIDKQATAIKLRNTRDSQLLDTLFTDRQKKEQELRTLEQFIAEEQTKAESAIAHLDQAKQTQYAQLKKINTEMQEKATEKQRELDAITQKTAIIETDLARDPSKKNAAALVTELSKLISQKMDLEKMQAAGSGEDKNAILQKVKEDTAEIQAMERQIEEATAEAKRLQESLAILDQESHGGEKAAKYEELVKKDKEMTEFLDDFIEKKQDTMKQLEEKEKCILAIIDRMKVIHAVKDSAAPSPETYSEVKADLKFKEKEMNNSQMTMTALQDEYAKRVADYEKILDLQVKLEDEVKELSASRVKLKEAISKMESIDSYREKARALKEKYQADIERLVSERKAAASALAAVTKEYATKKAEVERNDMYGQMTSLEQKLKVTEGSNFQLRESIALRKAESEYQPSRDLVMGLVTDVNEELIRAVQITSRPVK